MRVYFKGMILAGWALLAAGQVQETWAAGHPAVRSADFARTAASTPVGSRLRLDDVAVSDDAPVAFELERFQVFAENAEIAVHVQGGGVRKLKAPANVYFRGA